jgi:acetylornithine/succinyldiaminopimelate/putrescine aminotransferase
MRGPLLSGPVGSPAALERVCQIVRPRGPAVVLSALWLAQTLAAQVPVTALIEGDKRRGARRAVRRAARSGQPLMVVTAGEALPMGPGRAGCILVESLSQITDDGAAADLLARLASSLRGDGLLLAVEATKSPAVEARVAGLFLAAALSAVAQERPREGVLLTLGSPGPGQVVAARLPAE